MKYFWRICSTAFLVLISFWSTAQIQVTFPSSRAVFQRSNANQATLRVSGNYTTSITRIEGRLVARDGLGTTTDWLTLQDNPAGGVYTGDITGTGGWYNLEVRALNGSQPVGNTTTVERVGIGEVFIVAGQSNARGVHQIAPNPRNDLVNCVNSNYTEGFPNDPPKPVFTQLDNSAGFTMAPRGVGSWCWGQLGDMLVKRLRVPIMFFNAAFEGTAVRNWRESAPEGGTAYSVYIGVPYAPRQPYINLKVALQFYANMLGVRAVLWHQGEADNFANTSTQDYVNDLQFTIRQARQDFNRNMSWVVARATYSDYYGGPDAAVISAQNQVISATPNVFTGPNTDGIQIPRNRPPLSDQLLDGVHFDFNGLVEVANAWSTSLDESFFQSSTPIGPTLPPTVSVACAANNTLRLTVNGNFPTVQWASGESGSTITKGAGTYSAKIKDALGNTFFSPQIRVSEAPVAAVVGNGPPSICFGSNLSLTTNYDNVTWINQQTNSTVSSSRSFATGTEGAYFVRYRDVSGCEFTSNTLTATLKPLPATPAIVNDKPTTFCQGDNTVLRTSTDIDRYTWSDGQQNKVVTVGASGAYFLTVTDQFGCTSAPSNTIAVTANPVPVKPVIATSGPTTFCADRNITLTAPQNEAYQWTSGQTTQRITLTESGNFAVRTRNQFGCSSAQSDPVAIQVNPLPQSPAVSAGGSTTFCDGNRVTLRASSPLDILWTSGQTTKDIVVSSSGNYAAQARDQIGCLSTISTLFAVKVNPLPATPTILASPDRIICQDDKVTLRVDGPYSVFWSTGDSTQRITTGTAGTYSARVRDVNGCISPQAGNTTVELRPLPAPPTINMIGTYTLEAISSANGTQFRWYRGTDSLAAQSAIIKANQTGLYTARSSTIYSPILTCYSPPSAPFSYTIDLSTKGLSIYPNPNPDRTVTLETQENLVNARVTIFTVTGQQVFSTTVPLFDERKQIVLTGLSSGSYLVRVQAANFDVSKRILVGL